jgi:hypothetical protein
MFRPSFEILEKREVFSVDPLLDMAMATAAGAPDQQPADVYEEEVSLTDSHSSCAAQLMAGTYGRGIADFDNDGLDDLDTCVSPASGDPNLNPVKDDLVGWHFLLPSQVLPYIEQDNLYKGTAFQNTIFDDAALLSSLDQDHSARDHVFAELDQVSNSLAVASNPPSVLIGMLLPVKHAAQGIGVRR